MPQTKSQKIFYEKDSEYDGEIKNQLNRVDSFYQQNDKGSYTNGNVKVIIPNQN